MEPTRNFPPLAPLFFVSLLIDCMGCRSAEEAPEELQEGESQVNNIVYTFRLTSTTFDKKSYMTYLKVSPSSPLPPPSHQRHDVSRAT